MQPLYPKVKIGAFTYEVKYDDSLSEAALLGRIQLLHGVIDLRPNMSPDIEKLVLLHEVMHGFLFHAGIKEHDESHLDVLAHGVIQLTQDNPGLVG